MFQTIRIRQNNGETLLPNNSIWWWSVNGERWYPINERNVEIVTTFEKAERLLHFKFVRQFRNWILKGHTIESQGKYDKYRRKLYLNGEKATIHTAGVELLAGA